MDSVIVKNAEKRYKGIRAVDDISLTIFKKEIFGIVGPNGAGKTTLMECMMGLRKLDDGSITILGLDSNKDHKKLVYKVGAQLQQSELPANIKVKEAIRLQAGLFNVSVDEDDLMERYDLTTKAKTYFSKLSGGQKQRLFILLATINDPEIVIFDELSTGLDPVSRRKVWDSVLRLKEEGKTVIVSTHLMQEAEEICDRVVMINKGKTIGLGSVKELIRELPYTHVLEVEHSGDYKLLEKSIEGIEGITGIKKISLHKYAIYTTQELKLDILRERLEDMNIGTGNLSYRPCNFDDYFYDKVSKEGRD